jgi:hypothetical protein
MQDLSYYSKTPSKACVLNIQVIIPSTKTLRFFHNLLALLEKS